MTRVDIRHLLKKERLLLGLLFTTASVVAQACGLPYAQHEVHFESGLPTVAAAEIRRFADWRVATRIYYYSGFDVYLLVFEGGHITSDLAKERVARVQELLLNSGLPPSNLKETETRPPDAASPIDGPNIVRIDVDARCPNYCCREAAQ